MYKTQEALCKEVERACLVFERTSFKRLNKAIDEITRSEEAALSFLMDSQLGVSHECPSCKCERKYSSAPKLKVKRGRKGCYQCHSCKDQYRPIAHTILKGVRLPAHRCFEIIRKVFLSNEDKEIVFSEVVEKVPISTLGRYVKTVLKRVRRHKEFSYRYGENGERDLMFIQAKEDLDTVIDELKIFREKFELLHFCMHVATSDPKEEY